MGTDSRGPAVIARPEAVRESRHPARHDAGLMRLPSYSRDVLVTYLVSVGPGAGKKIHQPTIEHWSHSFERSAAVMAWRKAGAIDCSICAKHASRCMTGALAS